jgi:hypothetical protein
MNDAFPLVQAMAAALNAAYSWQETPKRPVSAGYQRPFSSTDLKFVRQHGEV